jgi:hypothetical protein
MSRLEISENTITTLQRSVEEQSFDDLLDRSTPSVPAVWDRTSRSFIRIHLSEDDNRLPECKKLMKELKEEIKQQLISECGDGWSIRMPFDLPIIIEKNIIAAE